MHAASPLRFPLWTLAVLGLAFSAGRVLAQPRQPHMLNALNALRSAHEELRQAEANKGGYRGQAQQLVTEAIGEVEAGIAFAGGM